ncbi:MAG TPA: efflux RND transporter periplasmic adaptor subunit [Oligoflexia bacterium]|nr:efflux RND transporter periplasmic adaptor subunit [Oligoflexia bacterium]
MTKFRTRLGVLLAATVFAFASAFVPPWSFAQGQSAEPLKTHYTCPMTEHADVVLDKPGRCPKCGMNLVPVTAPEQRNTPTAAPAKVYYCPMHPSYKSDRPGECPICHMSLVPLADSEQAHSSAVDGYAAVQIDTGRRQLIGLRLGSVEKKEVQQTIRAAARVESSEERISAVSLKFSGWVEELNIGSTGAYVAPGEVLFSVYSPELLEAQKNYLAAYRAQRVLAPGAPKEAAAFAAQSVRSARERLHLWDISAEQIRELETRNEPLPRMKIVSQAKGVVTKKNIVRGSYIEPGAVLYEVTDLSVVWIYADLYAAEIGAVVEGQAGTVELASQQSARFPARVIYIYPYLNEMTRTVRVRFEVDNTRGLLRPGDFGTVSIEVPLGRKLVVDERSVMFTGERQIAFVDLGDGKLEPREVKTGQHVDGLIVIEDGLREGEQVVTSGMFLVDSESRLKAALAQDEPGGHRH